MRRVGGQKPVGGMMDRIVEQARVARLEQMTTRARRYADFEDFLLSEVYLKKGKRYTFDGHRAFIHIVRTIATVFRERIPDAVLANQKGGQIGASTFWMAAALYAAAEYGLSAIYYLPDDGLAAKVSQTRLQPMASLSPLLEERAAIGKNGLLSFESPRGEAYVHTLGLYAAKGQVSTNAISTPADFIMADEVEFIPAVSLEEAKTRLAASPLKLEAYFSVGFFPGSGINAKFTEGCQYKWRVKCPACGYADQQPEEQFPESVIQVGGEWVLACVRCRKPYDVEECGEYVADFPSREADHNYSWRTSQLEIPFLSLTSIMKRYQKAQRRPDFMAKFECAVLGIPNAGSMQPITLAVLDGLERHSPIRLSSTRSTRPRVAGLDMGNLCHLAVMEVTDSGQYAWTWYEELDSDTIVESIARLWDQLGLVGLVVDSAPLTSEARKVAYLHPGQVWLQSFPGGDELDRDLWETKEGLHEGRMFQRVLVPRNAALDHLCEGLVAGHHLLPNHGEARPEVLELMRLHLTNLKKEEAELRGRKQLQYQHGVENHFGLAMQMAQTCGQLVGLAPGINQSKVEYERVEPRRTFRGSTW